MGFEDLSSKLFLFQVVKVLFLGVVGFLFSFLLTFLIIEILKKLNFRKRIRKETPVFYSLHKEKEGTVTGAGLGFLLSTIVLTLGIHYLGKIFNGFWDFLDFFSRSEVYLPFLTLIISGIVGFFDDFLGVCEIGKQSGGIGWKEKFLVYLGVGLFVTWWFYVKLSRDTVILPFLGTIDLGSFYFLFTLFVILGSLHSANLTDGLDGLLTSVSASILIPLIVISFLNSYYNLASFLSLFLGSLIGFSIFNFYPAKAFMGDAGSVSIGILIGTVSSMLNLQFYLLFFAFIFVLEALSVILQVISKKFFKKKIFISSPIHHHFQAKGLSEPNIVFKFFIINTIFAIFGFIIYLATKIIVL